eukprot:814625-Pyramimonas_sp.AAC.1
MGRRRHAGCANGALGGTPYGCSRAHLVENVVCQHDPANCLARREVAGRWGICSRRGPSPTALKR